MKNPIKKQAIIDTAINVGLGGLANVGVDYLFSNVDALASLDESTKNWIKVGAGIVGGVFTTNKYVHAATDGMATVGASNLLSGIIGEKSAADPSGAAGLPSGTIGALRRRMGQRGFINRRQVAGVGVPATAVVSK